MTNPIRNLLKARLDAKQDTLTGQPGLLGNSAGVVNITGRTGYVYVRVVGQPIAEVFNNRVPAVADLPVIVGYDPLQPGLYQVLSSRVIEGITNSSTGTSALGVHGGTHSWMASDPVSIDLRQFLPLRVAPAGGMLIYVYRGAWKSGDTVGIYESASTYDLTAHKPAAGKCCWVLVTLTTTGTVVTTKGAEVATASFAYSDIPAAPAGTLYALAAVRMYAAMTAIVEAKTSTDILDLRLTGGSGGGTSISVSDTASVDLTLTGGTLSAAVLPAGIKLDAFAAPDDVTTLNASLTAHGLLPKLGGGTANFLRADGTWAAPPAGSVATDIIWDAKGDLAVGTGADTAAKLIVGTNGQYLKADSTQATGLKWDTPAGSGDVAGPASATDGHLAVFDGTTGKLLKDGGAASSGSGIPLDGWITADAMTYASADSPTFTMTCSGDQTGKYSVGMRVKLTQTTVKYFIITAVSYSAPNTTITLYGGTDYTLANAAITSPYYSPVKAPYGFPLDPAKWTVIVTDTTQRSQASPNISTWYNLGSVTISIPIGCWRLCYEVTAQSNRSGAGTAVIKTTLSTANNSESDSQLSCLAANYSLTVVEATFFREKVLTLASKTSYYLNTRTPDADSGTTIYNRGDDVPTVIRAICAFL